jgi:nucleoside-diphosphate-sugar epimerase/predicted dehydrogenase
VTPPAIRVGLLGAGYIADWHARALGSVPGARVVAVCDQSRDRAAALAARCGAERAHAALDEMLAAGGLDAVHVLLPPTAHAAAAHALLAAGVPAYLEKPLCVTAAEADELASAGGRLAVGHNFLFAPPYERLKADLAAGRIGRVEHITVLWAKEFGPLRGGPFGGWVFRNPANILLEVGPHLAAHVLDLAGPPNRVRAEALDPVRLPGGAEFFRRWVVRTDHGHTRVDVRMAFGPGVTEHRVEVRGSAGTAVVDFEAGTYLLDRPTHLPPDFDRYRRTTRAARAATRQARGTLARYVLSKAGLVRDGNLFGASIAAAVRAFYATPTDPRLSAKFGAAVVRTCLDVARAAGLDPGAAAPLPAQPVAAQTSRPEVLVLGGTGFIGRALVRRLVGAGRRVRVLARDPASVPDDLRAGVEVCRGDLARSLDLACALDGVPTVVHLARPHARTWDDYLRDDIGVTRSVAEACLAAGVKRLVYTGTTDSYYSGRAEVITEDTPLDPKIGRRNLYARAKAAAEGELLALHRDRGLPVVVARPAVVIGPGGDPHHWGVGFWSAPHACRLWGDGTNPLPLVLADDVADALVRCLDVGGIDGEAFNLAADSGATARDYLAALSDATRTWIDARPTPPWRFYAGDAFKWMAKVLLRHPERRPPSLRDWTSRTYRARYDCSKACRLLGWSPVSDRDALLAEGVRRAATEWSA